LQVREVQRLHRAFEATGVPVLFYKGVVLGRMAYGDPALRPASDIDLLVAEPDFDRAEAVVFELGYHRDVPHRGWYAGCICGCSASIRTGRRTAC
ncbi:nucleotidyltransferase family protein, partial [Rhodothermus marinus]|uniref:nucleotidyltransferase family protein n=1 Tax=Rhodothermus marinus TaxID=29549 RepID=UPI000A95482C